MKQMRVKRKGRILAWLLTIAMAFSMVNVPMKARAADDMVTVENDVNATTGVWLTYTSASKYAADCWGPGSPAVDLYQYEFVLHNESGELISDWTVNITGTSAPVFNSGWNGVQNPVGNVIKIGTYQGVGNDGEIWNNKEISTGTTAKGMGMLVGKEFMDNAQISITYKIGASSGDVSQDDTLTDPAAIGQTSDQVKATLQSINADGDYHEYGVQVNNGLSESISDWLIAVPAQGISSTQDWSSWAQVSAHYTSEYLYITPASAAVIPAGGQFGDAAQAAYKINYTGNNPLDTSKAIVYYKTGNASTGAFDKVVDNASGAAGGSGGGGGGTADPFDGSNIGSIDTSQNYNFAKLLQLSLYFYDANMCGDKVSETSLFSKELYNGWRGDCHVNDKFTYNGKTYSAVGGFHDAGDHVKFGLPMAEAFSTLGIGFMEFREAFDELGQTQHFKTILDYYCTYVKSCTVLNASGEVEAFCYQVGQGDADHNQWGPPETENESSTNRSFTLVATSSNPATEIVSETAAALAINYMNFNNAEDLEYAEKLFAFAMNNNKSVGKKDGSFYGSSSWKDDYCLAAAMLYKATQKEVYKTQYNKQNGNSGNLGKTYDWDNVYQAAALYAPEPNSGELDSMGNWFNSVANSSKASYYCASEWGSARYNCNVQLMMLVYDKLQGKSTYLPWAKYQMSMILGNNSTKKNLIVGYNDKSPKQPHHRAASGQTGWDKFHDASVESVYTLFGALVGGPTTSDFSSYKDLMDDDHTSEVTLDYNAGLVGAAAALYLAYKDSTEEGFTEQTVLKNFYGGSEFGGGTDPDPVPVTGVTLDKSTLALTTNGDNKSATLKATVAPANATNKKVTWTSSDTEVAAVDSKGIVTAVGNGTATITVTSEESGRFTASCEVTVTTKVTGITLDETELTLAKGSTSDLKATVAPANATNKNVTWTSSDTKVATVSGTGLSATVTAVGGGTATITATAEDGSFEGICTVTVNVPVTGIALDANTLALVKSDEKKNTAVLTASVEPEDAADKSVTWSAFPEGIVTVEPDSEDSCRATVTALKNGTATVTVTTVDGGKTAECSVTVTNPITGIAFETDSMELETNEAAELPYEVTPLDGDKAEVTCVSSNTAVVSVSDISAIGDDGRGSVKLTGKAKGDADITVTVNGKTAVCRVTVVGKKVESVTMKKDGEAVTASDSIEMTAKASKTLADLGLEAVVVPADADNQTITWSIADKSIATIEDGAITALKAGETKLVAKAGNKTAECALVVNKVTQAAPEVIWTTVKRTSNELTIRVDYTETEGTSGILEYTRDGGTTWQDVPEGNEILLTELKAFTEYGLQVRLKGDDIYEESAIAGNTYVGYTLVEDPYTIDISKLSDVNYVNALRVPDETMVGHQTVEYLTQDSANPILILTDGAEIHEEGYVITGSNDKLGIVISEGVKCIAMDGVTCKALVSTDNLALELTITGENHVLDAVITSDKSGSKITIQGDGSLDTKLFGGVTYTEGVEGVEIAPKGDLVIAGGTVNVTGTEADSIKILNSNVTGTGDAAVAVDSLTVTGGTMTVEAKNTGIKANEITVSGGGLSIADTEGAAISSGRVDINGGEVAITGAKAEGISGDVICITDGKVSVTSEGTAIKANDSISISGGEVTLTVTGEDTKSVIAAENEISLTGGKISTTKPAGSTDAVDFGVNDNGTIIVDGAELQGTPSYSKTPVDKDGHEVKYITVKFMESGKAEPIKTLQVRTKSVLDINEHMKDYASTKAGYELTWSAGGVKYKNTDKVTLGDTDLILTAVWTKLIVNMADVSVSAVPAMSYTGEELCPKPQLTYNGAALQEAVDYTLAYSDNVNVGTAVITITGQGAFTGSKTVSFTIQPKAFDGVTVQIDGEEEYTGSGVIPDVTVYDGTKELDEDKDYTLAYRDNVNVGTATVIVTGKGNYSGEKQAAFDIRISKNASFTVGNFEYKVTNAATNGKGTVSLVKVKKKTATVNISATVNIGGVSFKITAIGDKAFKGNTKMTVLKMSKNVATIGANAFYGCKKLKTATIGSGVKKIGKKAFYNCRAMKKLTISSKKLTKKNIGAGAFTKMGAKNYKKLTVKVPKSKLKAYKKMLQSKGLSKKAKVKK